MLIRFIIDKGIGAALRIAVNQLAPQVRVKFFWVVSLKPSPNKTLIIIPSRIASLLKTCHGINETATEDMRRPSWSLLLLPGLYLQVHVFSANR